MPCIQAFEGFEAFGALGRARVNEWAWVLGLGIGLCSTFKIDSFIIKKKKKKKKRNKKGKNKVGLE